MMERTQKIQIDSLGSATSRAALSMSNPKNAIILFAIMGFFTLSYISKETLPSMASNSSLATSQALEDISTNGIEKSNVPFDGILHSEWCKAPEEPPLPYFNCKRDKLMRIGVYGGLTNALGFILKGGIQAFQHEWCYYVEEGEEADSGASKLARRVPPENTIDPFLERYFEPIGLPKSSELVKNKDEIFNQNFEMSYGDIQHEMYGKHSGGIKEKNYPDRYFKHDIPSLGLYGKDVVWLKKYMLRRMIRLLPERREESCRRLDHEHGLKGEYIAMSVRRGDKAVEFELVSSMQPYVDKAELAIETHFGGIPPKIFVATDDCEAFDEIRQLRPDWTFVSECQMQTGENHGFVIGEMEKWTLEETDAHYSKFFTELIAMASAKYFIGTPTTNVSIFVYFMRSYFAADDTWTYVGEDDKLFNY